MTQSLHVLVIDNQSARVVCPTLKEHDVWTESSAMRTYGSGKMGISEYISQIYPKLSIFHNFEYIYQNVVYSDLHFLFIQNYIFFFFHTSFNPLSKNNNTSRNKLFKNYQKRKSPSHTWKNLRWPSYLTSLSICAKTSLSLKNDPHWESGLGFSGWSSTWLLPLPFLLSLAGSTTISSAIKSFQGMY